MSGPVDIGALVERATRAPSSHNTQPWRFRATAHGLELHADRTRALRVNDPHDRELTISCGAALFTFEVAAAAAGHGTTTTLLPDPAHPDRLAAIELGGDPAPGHVALGSRIEARRTTRAAFAAGRVEPTLAADLLARVAGRGDGWLALVDDAADREAVAQLVAAGARAQFANARWRRELASWMRPRSAGDGLAVPAFAAPLARAAVRALDLGRSTAARDHRLALAAPLLAVLGSARDDPRAWLETGRTLQALLLAAAARDVQAGYLNQPCQVAELRPQLRRVLGAGGFPQIVMRLGRAPSARHRSARRPIADVFVDARG